jgi:hypothetical protein
MSVRKAAAIRTTSRAPERQPQPPPQLNAHSPPEFPPTPDEGDVEITRDHYHKIVSGVAGFRVVANQKFRSEKFAPADITSSSTGPPNRSPSCTRVGCSAA